MIKNKYVDLIEQTFYFPRHGFDLTDNALNFHDIPLVELIEQYGSPLKFTYLPKIDMQIQQAKQLFAKAINKNNYKGNYTRASFEKRYWFRNLIHLRFRYY